jgi:hypothetical protein
MRFWEGAMRRTIGLSLAAVAVLLMNGCASVDLDETARFKRRGTSVASLKGDSDQCWRVAQKSNISDSEATGDMVAGYVLFGLVGMAVASGATEEARNDPKNYHRRKVHDECMVRKGYKRIE